MTVVHHTSEAMDIALTARHAMQILRDSSLAGTPFYAACDRTCFAIDGVLREAERLHRQRSEARS